MLWMVRAFPDQTDRMTEFLEGNIIAVYWGIGNLTECTSKQDVAKVVAQANLQPRDASLKIGLLHRFVNLMKVGDYCIIPYHDVFYTCIIRSDYYFDPNSQKFEHQRKVEWLFDGEPFSRDELPEPIQASIKTQLGLADINQHTSLFVKYLNQKQGIDDLEYESSEITPIEIELNSLLIDAMKIIKDEINSDDPDRRLKAAIAVMELNNK
jgi:predicted Mrr-cat superfamily restriction endonuclease